jgi:hypothetical protein
MSAPSFFQPPAASESLPDPDDLEAERWGTDGLREEDLWPPPAEGPEPTSDDLPDWLYGADAELTDEICDGEGADDGT